MPEQRPRRTQSLRPIHHPVALLKACSGLPATAAPPGCDTKHPSNNQVVECAWGRAQPVPIVCSVFKGVFEVVFDAFEVNFDACEVTFDAFEVTFNACEVTFNACEVNFNACEVTFDASEITFDACKATSKTGQTTSKSGQATHGAGGIGSLVDGGAP